MMLLEEMERVPSPLPGVERMILDRIGGEVARAPSLVRYAQGWKYQPYSKEGCMAWVKTGHLTPLKLGIYAQTATG